MADYLLAVDTSTPGGSVALYDGDQLLAEFFRRLPGTHSDWLLAAIEQLLGTAGLQVEDLGLLAVVRGPGSFTGLRVGMATVKGLAIGSGVPVVGLSSLTVLAAAVPFARMPVCTMLDARKKEVYAGLFDTSRGRPVALGEERVLAPERLLETLNGDVLFVGDGALAYRTLIIARLGERAHFVTTALAAPRAGLLGSLARDAAASVGTASPEALTPLYLRASEAEINWEKRHSAG
ncbi:tRNA (adenosine(37)-N6)-threonylcarbamoyltransferase complex dimerization subunit type 1 TsaB [Geothermobacter hydrogeniphilus]|uniref:tRNA (adenosine(37)-N6)-threonylcarbamoyltransferase complex dimerization subunit type 1 TsaB n=1 Tax=Geothermobacter hydrogeniphilus TaxID=1969733 RepID=UPI001304B447|nr:tRNA (adenosine(37)-N6)-threonylcarbamoyltransferase complex dimerization subunit type 1 TsaB [Geothermobacter hydrogeniphilus]